MISVMELNKLTIRAAAVLIAAALSVMPAVAQAPTVSAKHAIVTDADTGAVLYEKDADSPALIASTTKIMTGCLICEQCDLQEKLTVPAEAVGIEGSSMYLKAGETLTVNDLLHGLLLQSGNDAATALAIHCSGSIDAFVSQMNAKASELGLSATHFANPSGLDDEDNYGTARDLAALTAYALRDPDFARIVSEKNYQVGERCLANHNKLLWRYDGAIGVKTGYTKAAGRILVSAARRGGRTLICVTIGAPDDWNDHMRLLDYGFSQYTPTQIISAGKPLQSAAITPEALRNAPLTAQESVIFPLLAGERVSCVFHKNDLIPLPLRQGTEAGALALYLGQTCIGTVRVNWSG